MTTELHWPVADLNAEFNHKASVAALPGDLLYWDNVNKVVVPFNQLADLGTAALMQASVARLFVGVSNSQQLSTDSTARPARVLVDGIYDFPCDSSTFEIGDFVGASYNTNILRNQQVAKVSYEHLAIGRVVKRYASATTKVKCRLLSRYLLGIPDRFRGVGACGQGTGSTSLADQNNTLTVDSNPILYQTPGANPRKLILPAEAQSAGLSFYITNLAGATNAIQVRDSGDANTIISIPATKAGIVWCDGTTWRGIVGA